MTTLRAASMSKKYAAAFALLASLLTLPALMVAQDPKAVLTSAMKAMGGESLKTIQFTGMGSMAAIGQNRNPRAAWPLSRMKTYTREIDFGATASHVRLVRVQAGADQTQEQYIAAASPWNTQFAFWLTPFGFLKGALESNASVRQQTIDQVTYNVVSYSLNNKYRLVGYIDEQNIVHRVQTWVDNDVLGDMLVEASYSVYKDFNGLKFPSMIIESHGGFPVLVLGVTDVKPNAPVNVVAGSAPVAVAANTPAAAVVSEKIAEGVYYLKGGTHHSVAVEFADHVAVIEAPQNEQRSLAVIAEVHKLAPNKRIRYIINTHHHFDHSGGLRTYVAEGVTIVTHQSNKEFYEKAFSTRRSFTADRLSQSEKKPTIDVVADMKVLGDAARKLELHLIRDNPHDDGILLAFLPKEKILIEVDVYAPPAAAVAAGSAVAANPNTANLVDNVERLKLDFETILPLHGPGVAARSDLYRAIAKPVPDITQILNPPAAQPVAQAGQRGQRGAPAADPAAALLSSACSGCHNLLRVQNKKATEDEWAITVERMKGKGAQLSEEETHSLVDYLARTYK
jgi:hypothetical protein